MSHRVRGEASGTGQVAEDRGEKRTFAMIFFFFLIYLFMVVLGLRFCARALSSCGKRGPLFIAVRRPLTIATSLAAEHRLQTRRLSNYGSRAQLLCGMWDPPRPGLEPVYPALAGRLSTTAPPGKPAMVFLEAGKTRLGRVNSSGLASLSNSGGLYVIGVVPRCPVPGPWIWNLDLR